MSKLFITPKHGNLGKTVEALRDDGQEVTVIGWGYPPIYVEADKSEHEIIKETVRTIDDSAKFSIVRPDLVTAAELHNVLLKFGAPGITLLCNQIGVIPNALNGFNNNPDAMASDLINQYTQKNELPKLVKEAADMRPEFFQ